MRLITVIGIIFILLGIILVLAPVLVQYIRFENIPSWLLFVYRQENFYFATSPILIVLSIFFLILRLFLNNSI
ncbi:hypothetical protein AKJ49_00690 [candidate division MSBL1 archaeon SCGC-AAA382A03]|uniref:DUF2905 domain-containing protein n=1 Tax=candidate division MSBL1 archaeon SCGC-AAA382A03 TaxID=1698278 RepID=A0A133VGB2_9EURY|nr:hypothetical protein AKJ49_00690 [candidate division MSBL1 archaeon SCGC-AAA382A03]